MVMAERRRRRKFMGLSFFVIGPEKVHFNTNRNCDTLSRLEIWGN
jgi:hypothetical protein